MQDERHHLHHKLRQRQIRCREPDERHAGSQPRSACQTQRRKTMVLGLSGGPIAQAAPTSHISANAGCAAATATMPAGSPPGKRYQCARECRADQKQQLHLQALRRQPLRQRPRQRVEFFA